MARKRYKIIVSAKNIRQGDPFAPRSCPVALAIDRALGKTYVDVKITSSNVIEAWSSRTSERVHFRARAAKKVETFLDRFDAGKPVKPFSFTLVAV